MGLLCHVLSKYTVVLTVNPLSNEITLHLLPFRQLSGGRLLRASVHLQSCV